MSEREGDGETARTGTKIKPREFVCQSQSQTEPERVRERRE